LVWRELRERYSNQVGASHFPRTTYGPATMRFCSSFCAQALRPNYQTTAKAGRRHILSVVRLLVRGDQHELHGALITSVGRLVPTASRANCRTSTEKAEHPSRHARQSLPVHSAAGEKRHIRQCSLPACRDLIRSRAWPPHSLTRRLPRYRPVHHFEHQRQPTWERLRVPVPHPTPMPRCLVVHPRHRGKTARK